MKRTWTVTLLMLLSWSAPAWAQQPTTARAREGAGAGGQQQRPGMLIERLRESLDDLKLTDDQKQKIDTIFDKAREDMRGMMQELRQADPMSRRERLREAITGIEDQIKATLNSEQTQAFEQKAQALREQIRGGGNARVNAAPNPSTQPGGAGAGAGPAGGAGQMRPGAMLERLTEAAQKLDLNDDQKAHIKQVLEQTRSKFQDIREQAKGDMQAAREKMQPVLQEMREKITSILSPDQQQKLREIMTQAEGAAPDGARRGARREGGGAAPPATSPAAAAPTTAPTFADVGQSAPDFTLKRLDGQSLQLSSLKGRVVLLVFGSYSSPSFRQRAPGLEQLNRQYGNRIHPLVIYTRENYPTGGWEVDRNKDEGIAVKQATTLDERITQARKTRDALKLSVPMLIDSMDDLAANAYGGQSNAAILIGRDGKILARQKWFEPYGMRRAIDEAIKESPKNADRSS
jgi:Spy/CpxP family protein refolding chaperone